MTRDTGVLCDVTFEVGEGVDDDTGEPTIVLYVILPDDDATRFGCALTPDNADRLALVLQEAAGVTSPVWPAIGLS